MVELIANQSLRVGLLILIFALVMLVAYVVATGAMRSDQLRKRVATLGRRDGAVAAPSSMLVQNDSASVWRKIMDTVEKSGLSLSDKAPDALRKKLLLAGFSSPEAPRVYGLIRLVLIFVLPGVFILTMVLSGSEVTFFKLYVIGSGFALLGLVMPTWIVRIMADRRMETIRNGFPNCLDLMLVCVESGLGMEAAFDRVSRELAGPDPLVAELLVRTTQQLRAGASREQALRRMAELAGVGEINSFCTLLIQSEKLGTSIGDTLRVFAAEMRERRKMRAEEKAHRLPVLISIPLVTCMLPTMTGVLMLPAIVRVVRDLIPAMGG